jgi:hypothetical protein
MFYEAQGIGRFLIELGYWIRAMKIENGGINLFQQTPLDPAQGDLSLFGDGRYVMIEFKVNETDASEQKKTGIRRRMRRNLEEDRQAPVVNGSRRLFRHVSEDCHFLAKLSADPDEDVYTPYMNTIQSIVAERSNIYGQQHFISQCLLGRVEAVGVEAGEFQKYLEMLYQGCGAPTLGSDEDNMVYCFRIDKDSCIRWSCAKDLRTLFPAVPHIPKTKPGGP